MKQPVILNINTASEFCSVCISKGNEVLALKEAGLPNDHSRVVAILIEDCTKEASVSLARIDAVAISTGPGSYTSLRVGASVAKGICYALGKPLIPVDTLQAMARAVIKVGEPDALYCPMIDARRMEVYCAVFNANNEVLAPPAARILDSESFHEHLDSGKKMFISGSGALKFKNILTTSLVEFVEARHSATELIFFSNEKYARREFVDLASFSPLYLKPPNLTTPRATLSKALKH